MKKTLFPHSLRRLALLLLLVIHAALPAWSATLAGDVDGDGEVSIADVANLIDYLLTDDATGVNLQNADVNQDGLVDIADVADLIDYLLKGSWPEAEHEWVDLGLSSGTLWATCNVGANSPEDYGDFFAWGETSSKGTYSGATYKWCNGNFNTLTKYCTYGEYGTVDNKTELEPEDDAAHVNWGPSWRMPTSEQFAELYDECSRQWTQKNGVNGDLFIGPNGKTLFFPAAGDHWGDSHNGEGACGYYWSRTLYTSYPYAVYDLYFDSESCDGGDYSYRYRGFTVRAVRVQ